MKKFTLLCLVTFFAASFSHAQKRYDELTYPELNEFQKPQVETFTTDNGIKFFLVEDNELPLINVNVNVRTGGVMISNKKAGLTSITGTVIRSGGTETYSADKLNVLLENNAASIETWIGFSSGSAGMSVLKEDFNKLLPVFIDVLTNPAFPKEKIALAKTQQKTGISRRNTSSQQIGIREFQRLIYGKNSVYGRNTEYETINNISREDLVNFHEKYFVAENLMVGVVGDFDASEMKEKLKEAFSDFPEGPEATLDFPEVDYRPHSSINFIHKSDINQSFVMMGHLGGLRSNPDYAEIQVMNQVLSGGISGRLFKKIRTDLGLAYAVFGQYSMNSFFPGWFYTGVMTKSATTAEAIDAIIKQIERLQNEPITQEELEATKAQILNSAVFEYDSYEQVLYKQMANAYRGLPANSFEQYLEGVKTTTIEDVQRVAQEYLNPDQLQILVVGNKEQIGDQLKKYGDVNVIDITIPQPGNDENKVVQGDAAKGAELLHNMADAIIASGKEPNTLSFSGDLKMMNRTLATTISMDFPNAIEQSIETPRGTIVMNYEDGSATMSMGAMKRNLPPSSPRVSALKASLNRNVVAIALKAGALNPVFTGTEEVDGKSYSAINIKINDTNITLLLDKKTYYPAIMRFIRFVPRQGKSVTVENHYSDWKTNGGVAFPYLQTTSVNGSKKAEMVVKSHSAK